MGLSQDRPTPDPNQWTLTALFLPDLSFNNIEAIEGLDTLVNLEDLSLFNNRISKIDSLDALVKLQVLSLGNNEISHVTNVSARGRRAPGLEWLLWPLLLASGPGQTLGPGARGHCSSWGWGRRVCHLGWRGGECSLSLPDRPIFLEKPEIQIILPEI